MRGVMMVGLGLMLGGCSLLDARTPVPQDPVIRACLNQCVQAERDCDQSYRDSWSGVDGIGCDPRRSQERPEPGCGIVALPPARKVDRQQLCRLEYDRCAEGCGALPPER